MQWHVKGLVKTSQSSPVPTDAKQLEYAPINSTLIVNTMDYVVVTKNANVTFMPIAGNAVVSEGAVGNKKIISINTCSSQ